ncbi:cardiolipin synthase [Pseudochelatococcus lubricantis]|uniref:CDP-diacylglycerol--glycerol-3-phosphate 3-phosphatidyltransferase n=1 Tax=Pseudochelatococcus lubricantis TaxID=1538102 RepID=A0ABX0UVN5_9HYPH|nr:CDP-alcohol phosphatidyltransferase family protein [Pseudochelatococcus lubricantis]NIJ56324.1 cardiolipin synthase [Pseudochelatococcus lubricantis]
MTIPNLITILRLLLVPVIVASIGAQAWLAAFVMFVVAGLSDGVDGYIARRFDMRSELGAYLDAFADKALLVSIYVALSVVGVLPGWLAILVVSRDVLILMAIAISWLMTRPVAIRPLLVSKLNTAAQIGFAALTLGSLGLAGAGPAVAAPWLFNAGMASVVGLTLLSAGAYLTLWLRHMAE